MGRPDGQAGEQVAGYEYRKPSQCGQWGVWTIPLENVGRLKQLSNDRLSMEIGQSYYEASREERDTCYREVLDQLPLAHCDLLDLESRGLTREQIAHAGFKSVERWQTLRDEVNWRVPGIGPSGRNLFAPWDGGGYLCPARDLDGRILAMQVRLRRPGEGGRYRWLSTSNKNRANAPLTSLEGELPLSVFQQDGCDRETIWFVEGTGPKPAITLAKTNCLVIGASGGQWVGSPHYLKSVLDRVQPKNLILAPDAGSIQPDKMGQQQTILRYTRLRDMLKDWGYELEVAWWGQEYKPETHPDKLKTGDIDEIEGFAGMAMISFDRLRHMAAQALQAGKLKGDVRGIGKAFPDARTIPEPEPLPEEAPKELKLQRAVEHWMKVDAQGNPFTSFLYLGTIKEQFGASETKVREFASYIRDRDRADGGLTSTSDIFIDVFGEMEQRANGLMLPGVPCGFYDLDGMTQGYQRSDLIIAAARPSIGKTTMIMNQARNIAAVQKLPVGIFSLEMSKIQLAYKLLSAETEIESSRLRTGRIAGNEWEKVGHGISLLSQTPIFIDDTANISVTEMAAKSRRLQAEQGVLGLLVVDYVQLMDGGSENRQQEISKISRQLKSLARELNTPVIAISQLSRGVESRTNKRPMMSDLRESGQLEQDADLIMMLYREEYYDPDTPDRGIAEVNIVKHRNGPTGTVKLLFEPQFNRFRNLANTSLG